MVAAINHLQSAAQVAQTVTDASKAAQVAQKALTSAATLSARARSLSPWTLDAAGNTLIRSVDGTYLPLDQILNGPLLPRVQELHSLREAWFSLESFSHPLSQATRIRIERLPLQFSPAEGVQLLLRPASDATGGDFSVDLPTTFRGLQELPLYPSVHERLLWDHRASQADSILQKFCEAKADIISEQMSEVEAFQYAFMKAGKTPTPSLDISWTPPVLQTQPLTGRAKSAARVTEAIEFLMDQANAAESTVVRARYIANCYSVMQHGRRLRSQLSDDELMQLILATK